jgi:glycosyltransferase involved in cell wall biosynthesis
VRLCILTQYFPPEMGAPPARLWELGERLVDRGWEVEALTALPNYPTGRVFPGYSPRRPRVESVGRIRCIRVPLWPARSGFVGRLACYYSFAISARYFGPRLCHRPDVLLVESPPLFIGHAARGLSRRWGVPYVFNVSDLWPESAIRMGVVPRGWLSSLAERLELGLYRDAAAVTGQSDETVASIRARAPGTLTELVTNGVDPSRFGPGPADPMSRELLGREPGPTFVYAGLLGLAQGLDQILDLGRDLPPEVPGRFVLIGDGPVREHLVSRVAREALHRRVRIVPAQPRELVPSILAAADAAIISLGTILPGAVPSKIYEAMAASLPILLIGEGEPARRVEEAGAGLAVRVGDPEAAQEAFVRLATDEALRARLGAAGRQAALSTYNRALIAERLHVFLREVVRRSRDEGSATPSPVAAAS